MQKHNKLKEAIDLLAGDGANLSTMLKDGGLLKQLSKGLIERALESEMDDHLGYQKYDRNESDNFRNGTTGKQLTTEQGVIDLKVPRDRESSFEPALIKKRQTRIYGLDDKILSLYAKGMSLSDIRIQLEEFIGCRHQ